MSRRCLVGGLNDGWRVANSTLRYERAGLSRTSRIERRLEILVSLAREQVRVYEDRMAALDATEARLADDPVRAQRLSPLRLGRAVYEAGLSFWSSVAQAPDEPASWAPG